MQHAINFVLSIILTLAELVLGAVAFADAALAGLMTSSGLPPGLQIIMLVLVGLLLIVFALRALGRVFAILIIALLVLLILHRTFPGMQPPHSMLPPNWRPAGSVHI